MTDGLILGIDGGGSKVLAALADRSGQVVKTARGGGVNPMDNPGWREGLDTVLRPFAEITEIGAVAAALPAYGEVSRLSALQEQAIAETFPAAKRHVLNDVEAAHFGALSGQPGILILSGTGSMAWARDEDGCSARVGGWGDMIGDEGSAYAIGRAALSLISQAIDGRARPTALTDAVFDALSLDRTDPMNALGDWVTGLERPRAGIAALAEVVDRVARTGDAGANALMEQAADELARHVSAIAPHCASDADWTYAGGTFASPALLAALTHRIGRAPVPPRLPPIGGALLAAAQCLGWPLEDGFVGQIASARNGTD